MILVLNNAFIDFVCACKSIAKNKTDVNSKEEACPIFHLVDKLSLRCSLDSHHNWSCNELDKLIQLDFLSNIFLFRSEKVQEARDTLLQNMLNKN